MINTLPDENDRNALIAAITMYQFNGQIPTLSPVLNLVFLFIKKEIDIIMEQIKAVEARKEARRAKRTAKPCPQQAVQPMESSKPQQDSVMPDKTLQPVEVAAEEPLNESLIPECPAPMPSKAVPLSKNKKFNSILRAKERHDRLKQHSINVRKSTRANPEPS